MRLDNYEKNDVHMPDSHPLEALSARLNIIENNIEESNINSNFPPLNWCTVANKAVKNNKTPNTKAPKQQIEIINTIASEQLDRARRKNRLIVFGRIKYC